MRKMSSKKMHSMLHRVLIPLAVVTSSSTILAISYWYHEQQLTQQLNGQQTGRALSQEVESQIPSKTANQNRTTHAHATTSQNKTPSNSSTTTPVGSDTVNVTQAHSTTTSAKPSNSKSKTKKSTRSKSALSNTSTNPAKKPATKSATSKSKTTPPHSAVQGGVAKSVTNEQLTNTTIQSAVIQFGNHPQTTGLAGQLQSGWGTSLSLPKSIATNRLLAVSLHSGILWAVVPPTDINPDGQLGLASSPTNVMYTPYPPKGSKSLTDSSIVVGEIPVNTASEKALGLSWTHVKPQQKYVVQSSSTATTATTTANNSTSNKGTNVAQSNATNTSAKAVTNTALNKGKHVFLSSLYKDDFGGVIVLDVLDASASETKLVYSFNENNRSIQEVASLPNDGTKYSWLAVSKDHLYWGIRTVNAQNPSAYHTKQFLYNLESQSTNPISLGTWTGAVYVNGDHLVYQVKNTTTWKEFIPSVKQPTKTSTETSGNTSSVS